MTTIYLPIEISRREIVAKSFLAASLAARGHMALIFRADLFDRAGWPGRGIYIGKNVFRAAPPHDLSFYRAMKRCGIRVWYLDEEGGIYLGENEGDWRAFMARRVDPSALDAEDKILTWGDWQNEFFSARGLRAPIHTTGHLNFDICQPRYQAALAKFDAHETRGESGYILVNTRFTMSNARDNGASHIIHTGIVRQFFDQALLFDKLVSEGKSFFAFIDLIGAMSAQFPDRQIVLRPHPGESPDIYSRIFASTPSVIVAESGDVGSWIRRASCVIHNGCTTAIQAAIAGKPVITFMPYADDARITACLPNTVGTVARTVDEVLRAVERLGPLREEGHWQRTISRLDTIDRITALVDEADSASLTTSPALVRRFAARFDASEIVRAMARLFLPERRRSFRKSMELFDPAFFSQIGHLAPSAAAHYGARVRVRRMSRFCYAFLPPADADTAGTAGIP